MPYQNVRNSFALCADGKQRRVYERVVYAGIGSWVLDPDTYFSLPAYVWDRGRKIYGYTTFNDEHVREFHEVCGKLRSHTFSGNQDTCESCQDAIVHPERYVRPTIKARTRNA